jgi:hypothetical protein
MLLWFSFSSAKGEKGTKERGTRRPTRRRQATSDRDFSQTLDGRAVLLVGEVVDSDNRKLDKT